jgi:hypothetical protein
MRFTYENKGHDTSKMPLKDKFKWKALFIGIRCRAYRARKQAEADFDIKKLEDFDKKIASLNNLIKNL